VFASGGVGGVVSVGAFWVFAIAIVVMGTRYLVDGNERREKVRWAIVVAAISAIGLRIATDDTPAEHVANLALLVCLVALLVLWARTLGRRIRGVQP
jgi:O-antigen/teichoic acid export membrane protein